jgi:hypothetical protein
VGKTEGQRPRRRTTRRLDNTHMHLKQQDRMAGSGQELVVSSCGHGYERLGSIKYWELLH